MTRKAQRQLLINQGTADRVAILALGRGEPQAEVLRLAIEGRGLADLEAANKTVIDRVHRVAEALGMQAGEMAERALRDKLPLESLEGRKRYPTAVKA